MRSPLELLYNFHWIVPDEAARSSQAFLGLLPRFLTSHHIKALINLRGYDPTERWWTYEQRTCERLSIRRFDAMLDSRKLPTRNMLVSLIAAFDTAPRPLLLKCAGGQDRASFAASLYVLHRDGWGARSTAQEQFSAMPYLHFPKRQQRWLREFPAYAEAEARGATLSEWLSESYDPNRFAAWLRERGQGESFAGLFPPPHERIRIN
jgi:protein tyrosine/serine phosphatase